MRYTTCCLVFVALASAASGVSAQQIYKSVDEHGNVTYSATPPSGSVKTETLPPPPAPSQEAIEQAQKDHEALLQFGEALERERKTREAEERARREEEARRQPRVIEREIYVPVPVAPGYGVGPRPLPSHPGGARPRPR